MDHNDKIELRTAIKTLYSQGLRNVEIKNKMKKMFGDRTPHISTIKKWTALFKEGRETLNDTPPTGRPNNVVIPVTISRVEAMVKENERITVFEISRKLEISVASVKKILNKHLMMRKIDEVWMRQKPAEENKKLPEDSTSTIEETEKKTDNQLIDVDMILKDFKYENDQDTYAPGLYSENLTESNCNTTKE